MQNKLFATIFLAILGTQANPADSVQWHIRGYPLWSIAYSADYPRQFYGRLDIERTNPNHAWSIYASRFRMDFGEGLGLLEGISTGFAYTKPWGQSLHQSGFIYKFSSENSLLGASASLLSFELLSFVGYRFQGEHWLFQPEIGIGPALLWDTDDHAFEDDAPVLATFSINLGLGLKL